MNFNAINVHNIFAIIIGTILKMIIIYYWFLYYFLFFIDYWNIIIAANLIKKTFWMNFKKKFQKSKIESKPKVNVCKTFKT